MHEQDMQVQPLGYLGKTKTGRKTPSHAMRQVDFDGSICLVIVTQPMAIKPGSPVGTLPWPVGDAAPSRGPYVHIRQV
ncbi:hypothetical protein N7508_001420 [Penicillium antarcticum]|uniref:uncharacterized protein n=1 Tax=Penicillium antarcticum TaxID=416450 RepID=UPI002389BD51|nr:uncharacterized protein N7508_001420 [Penicillium antarcticum]KAJ5316912.1 hypothetical protein N7508_001420 [Penicillium antarcticum]